MRLVLDWDGTCTVRDTLWMTLETFGDRAIFAQVEAALQAGTMSYREIMEAEMATVTAPLDEVNAFLRREARVRPGLHELAVMCDTFRPLRLTSFARDLDDGKYMFSWYEDPSTDGETPDTDPAGVTSHF